MARIAIVTDSTCDMDPDRLASLGVEMVPLKVLFGDETFQDWIEMPPSVFYPKLAGSATLPTTSQPSPQEFEVVYGRLADEGFDGIVSIHISAKLSGTVESATIASKTARIPVRVVDSLFVSGGAGLALVAACEARDAGGDLGAVESAALRTIERTELHFALETMENLVKGGRAGKAAGLAASILNIKPVLEVTGGVIVPFGKPKGTRKAIQMLVDHVAERSREVGPLRVIVIDAVAPELATTLEEGIRAAAPETEILQRCPIGGVIGTHVGAGAVGVASAPVK